MKLGSIRLLAKFVMLWLLLSPWRRRIKATTGRGLPRPAGSGPDFEVFIPKLFKATAEFPRVRVFLLAVFVEAICWSFRVATKQEPVRVGEMRQLNPDDFAVQRARYVSMGAAQATQGMFAFLRCVSRLANDELATARRERISDAIKQGTERLQLLVSTMRNVERVEVARAGAASMRHISHEMLGALLAEVGYFNPGKYWTTQSLRAERITTLLDRWAAILPIRIANEDLGEFVEQINRRIADGQQVMPYVQAVSAVFWTAINSIGYLRRNLR